MLVFKNKPKNSKNKNFGTVAPWSFLYWNSGATISPNTVELRRTESRRLVASILHIKILSMSLP